MKWWDGCKVRISSVGVDPLTVYSLGLLSCKPCFSVCHHLPTCSGQPARITGLHICKELPVDKPSHPESCSWDWVPGSGLSGWRSWGLSVSNLIRHQCQTSWALAQAFTCKPFAANQQTQLGLDSADTRYGQPPVGFSFPTVGAETGFWYLPVLAGLNKLSQGSHPVTVCCVVSSSSPLYLPQTNSSWQESSGGGTAGFWSPTSSCRGEQQTSPLQPANLLPLTSSTIRSFFNSLPFFAGSLYEISFGCLSSF